MKEEHLADDLEHPDAQFRDEWPFARTIWGKLVLVDELDQGNPKEDEGQEGRLRALTSACQGAAEVQHRQLFENGKKNFWCVEKPKELESILGVIGVLAINSNFFKTYSG